jgi:SpoVK/Ycf46/Vps4 family AAA+-type ATPase
MLLFFYRKTGEKMNEKLTNDLSKKPSIKKFEPLSDKYKLTFADVGGLEELKKEANIKIIQPFKNPELFKKFKKSAGGGILLYGPPGCGKSYFARSIAGECNAKFYNLGIEEILDMYVGESEKNIKELFDTLRKNRPAVLFIDEIDALGRKRELLKHSSLTTTINAFLAQMDGVESDNENILIIGATNAPWDVDSAFKRVGRFDRTLFISPPDLKAREEIFRLHLKDLPVKDIDYQHLAQISDKFSGADIKGVVDRASQAVIEEILKTAKEKEITQHDIESIIYETKPTTLEWLEMAKNVVEYANESGLYDELKKYLQRDKKDKRRVGFF